MQLMRIRDQLLEDLSVSDMYSLEVASDPPSSALGLLPARARRLQLGGDVA